MACNDSDSQPTFSSPSQHSGFTALKAYLALRVGEFLHVSEARKAVVLDDIMQGSTPRIIYYVLLGLSTLIAGFGLVANSPAVVIGAMLVSPLMTPIFGISLSLSRGNLQLLRDALVAEFGGVLLAIGLGWLLGQLPIAFDATPEILARTSPTLLDLLVATLAGLAGCLAMIDERISPALPGIAMATSLTPPLAASGLCLALGAYESAGGAFLLFFANFLAILAVTTTIFIVAGFIRREELGTTLGFAGRFAAAGVGLIVVAVILTQALVGIIKDVKTRRVIETVIETALASDPLTTVEKVLIEQEDDGIDVLSVVRTPQALEPNDVQQIETALAQALGEDVDLFFQCNITQNVSATGATRLFGQRNFDGEFVSDTSRPDIRVRQLAEQTLRELTRQFPDMKLNSVDLVERPTGRVVIAGVYSSHIPFPSGVQKVERLLQERLGDPSVRLVVDLIRTEHFSTKGRQLVTDKAHFREMPEAEVQRQATLEQHARRAIEQLPHVSVLSLDAVKNTADWQVRAEVVGPQSPSPADIGVVQQTLQGVMGQPVELVVWARSDVVVTDQRYLSREAYTEAEIRQKQTTK